MLSFFQGVALGGGLIIAIGAQNAFVLTQGVKRNFPLQTALVCSLCDASLILLGVVGVGSLIDTTPGLVRWTTWGGALFLLCYGARALRSAFSGGQLNTDGACIYSRRSLLLATLALTFLNPHVYLDTLVLVGGISGQLPQTERLLFAAGAISASVVWFFTLSLGAGLLAPLFRKTSAWRVLDGLVCLSMWGIALKLLWPEFNG